jgi:hypothetical protein
MGRKQLLDAEEASKVLGVHKRRVVQYTTDGWLRAVYEPGSRSPLYRPEDVYAMKEGREGPIDLPMLYVRALQGWALSAALEERIEALESMLNLDAAILSYEREEIVAEYMRTEDLAAQPPEDIFAIRDFAKVVLGIRHEYLELVERYTGDHEPWSIFEHAARRIRESVTKTELIHCVELATAHAELQASRMHLERVAFWYLYNRDGARAARKRFPKSEPDIHERILGHVFTPAHKAPGKR